jgi:hypothetical protein
MRRQERDKCRRHHAQADPTCPRERKKTEDARQNGINRERHRQRPVPRTQRIGRCDGRQHHHEGRQHVGIIQCAGRPHDIAERNARLGRQAQPVQRGVDPAHIAEDEHRDPGDQKQLAERFPPEAAIGQDILQDVPRANIRAHIPQADGDAPPRIEVGDQRDGKRGQPDQEHTIQRRVMPFPALSSAQVKPGNRANAHQQPCHHFVGDVEHGIGCRAADDRIGEQHGEQRPH